MGMDNSLEKRFSKVRFIISDVDGVLTDGKITIDNEHKEIQHYSVLDGMGLTLARENDIGVIFISGRLSEATSKRLKDLGVRDVYQGVDAKGALVDDLLAKRGMQKEEICALGDDLADLSLFRRCGLAVAVSNAVEEVKTQAQWTTQRSGGNGALREVVDKILKAKGLWPKVLQRFSS
jgi:3-deoxy-D-manno-octulosonate 8-phosphate phosphatase (KDO 8-P phosphatase)